MAGPILLVTQRARLTFRDKQGLVASCEMRGGSGASIIHSGCMAELTPALTAQLKALTETEN